MSCRCVIAKATGKIKNMSKLRQDKVVEAAEDYASRKLTVEGLRRLLAREYSRPTDKDRDWGRVAVTEMTDSAAKQALSKIKAENGDTVSVYRLTGDACPECIEAFGKPGKPRLWAANKIPAKWLGAVHPWCRCGPWMESSAIRKAQPKAVVPGMVRLDERGLFISDGTGGWLSIEDPTASPIIRSVILATPAFVDRHNTAAGYTIAYHGFVPEQGDYLMLDVMKLGSAVFVPLSVLTANEKDYDDLRQKVSLSTVSMTDYVAKMTKVLRMTAAMPEFWQNSTSRHLSTLFGYKLFTDMVLLIPEVSQRAYLEGLAQLRDNNKIRVIQEIVSKRLKRIDE